MGLHRWYAFATCALSTVSPLVGQDAPPIFDRLEGEWHGDGTLMGRTAQFTMSWQHRDGFAVLRFANARADTTGRITPVLNAVAVYRTAPQKPEAVWLDSRGLQIEIHWEAADSQLVAHWSAPDESGRTTYRVGTDAIEAVDEVLSGGSWRTFGTARYRRAG